MAYAETSPILKKLILITCLFSLGSALFTPLFYSLFGIAGPQDWLALSWWGIARYLLWQPISFLFVHPGGREGITLSFLIVLFFNLYLLWAVGNELISFIGQMPFLRFYLSCGIISGLAALFLIFFLRDHTELAGPFSAILGMMIVWAFFQPEREILFFFLIPLKAKWLSLGIVAASLLISLSQLRVADFILYFSGALSGYLYALIAWGVHSPFSPLARFEMGVVRFSQNIKRRLPLFKTKQSENKPRKIFNIKTGEPEDDEAFIDAMLEKISKYGEHSLTWSERQKMQEISKKKQKKD